MSYRSGLFWRPISSRSRKPLVVIRPVLAPLPSRMALVATVVPCMKRVTSAPEKPYSLWMTCTPSTTAADWSWREDGSLYTISSPVFSSTAQISVFVPPTSTPMRIDFIGCIPF